MKIQNSGLYTIQSLIMKKFWVKLILLIMKIWMMRMMNDAYSNLIQKLMEVIDKVVPTKKYKNKKKF